MNLSGVILAGKDSGIYTFSVEDTVEKKNNEKIVFSHNLRDLYNWKSKNESPLSLPVSEFKSVLTKFWKTYSDWEAFNKHYWRFSSDKEINFDIGLDSISLAIFLSPLLLLEKHNRWTCSYSNVCITGTVDNKCRVGAVSDIDKKFKTYGDYINQIAAGNKNPTFAFVYVSNDNLDETLKEMNPRITPIRFTPGTPIATIKNRLATKLVLNRENSNEFQDAVYNKMEDNISVKKACHCEMYVSGNDNTKKFFDIEKLFSIFKKSVDQGYPFSLKIFITKFQNNTEATTNYEPQSLPKWYNNITCDMQEKLRINNGIKIFAQSLKSQIKALKQDIRNNHAYENEEKFKEFGRLRISMVQVNSDKISLPDKTSTENSTENMLILNDSLIAYSDRDMFCCTEDKESVSDTIKSIREIFRDSKPKLQSILYTLSDEEHIDDFDDKADIIKLLEEEKDFAEGMLAKLEENGEPKNILTNVGDFYSEKKIEMPRFLIYGLPGMGKTTVLEKMAKIFNKHLVSSDILINNFLFDDNEESLYNPDSCIYNFVHTERDYSFLEKESAEFAKWVQKEHEEDKSKKHFVCTRDFFKKLPLGKKLMPRLRHLQVESALTLAAAEGSLCDLGAKEKLVEDTQFALNELNYMCILLAPATNNKEEPPIIFSDNEEAKKYNKEEDEQRFETYAGYYRKDPSLLDKKKRSNICALTECDPPKYSEKFKQNLKTQIWNIRWPLLNQKFDARVLHVESEDKVESKDKEKAKEKAICETTVNILKAVFTVYKNRLENELRLMEQEI